jgi:hypothetical protein
MNRGSGWLSAGVAALLLTAGCKQQGQQQQHQDVQGDARAQVDAAQERSEKVLEQAKDAQPQEQTAQSQQQAAPAKPQQVQQLVTGRVASASQDELLLSSAGAPGQPQLRLQLNAQTQVLVNGQQGSVADIPEGSQVRASYQDVGGEPTALRVDVTSSAQGASGGQQGEQLPQPSPQP